MQAVVKRKSELPLVRDAVRIYAAKTLQKAWRKQFSNYTTYKIVSKQHQDGPTIAKVRAISFEDLVVYLRQQEVVTTTKQTLQRIHLKSTYLHGSPSRMVAPENVNVRVFLAAFMIAYRPTHVFESMGPLETALLESAIPLLELFEKVGAEIMISEGKSFSSIPPDMTANFPSMLYEYLRRFKAWKVPDEAKLASRIKHALIALYQAQEHLPADESPDSKLNVEFRTQIDRLRSKLSQISGADALAQFDAERPIHIAAPPSNGGPVAAAIPGRMTNEQLAHELLIDPTFQLSENGGTSVENPVFHRIRESFHEAFWNSLVDDLKLAVPCYVRVLRVLAEIKEGINDLAGSRESASLNESIDIDFIRQQAEAGLFGWESCKRLITAVVGIVQRVQAPRRDAETRAEWVKVDGCMQDSVVADKPRAFCKGLEFLLDRVNAMRIDAANARLRLIAPVIRLHGIDYEKGKMTDKLNDGSLTLERTQAWIAKAILAEIGSGNVTRQNLLDGVATEFEKVHAAAILDLVTQTQDINLQNVPETLMFDINRFAFVREELNYITLAVTIMVTVSGNWRGTCDVSRAAVTAALNTIAASFVDPNRHTIDVDATCTTICAMAQEANFPIHNLHRAIIHCPVPDDAVNVLVRGRVHAVFANTFKTGLIPQTTLHATNVMLPRIAKIAGGIRVVCDVNRKVHMDHYNRIIAEEAAKLT